MYGAEKWRAIVVEISDSANYGPRPSRKGF
jgi:hypothetical protein